MHRPQGGAGRGITRPPDGSPRPYNPASLLLAAAILPPGVGCVMSARALPWTRSPGLTVAAQRRLWRQTGIAYLYLAPALLLLIFFNFLPAVYGFYISLWRWGIVQERFVGLENYQRNLVQRSCEDDVRMVGCVIGDEAFWKSLGVTLWYVILVIPAEMAVGL